MWEIPIEANSGTARDKVHIRFDRDSQCWVATFDQMPGCVGDGATPQEAWNDFKDASLEWLDEYGRQ